MARTKKQEADELTAQQQQAIGLLAGGMTVTEVAQEVGVERETVSRWKNHNTMFASLLSYQQAELWDAAADKLRASVLKAADSLDELLEHEDASVRLKAISLTYKALGNYPKNARVSGKEESSIKRDWDTRFW